MLIFVILSLIWKAGIAQLVEYKLPKLGVASSNLVARSSTKSALPLIWGRKGITRCLSARCYYLFSDGICYDILKFRNSL